MRKTDRHKEEETLERSRQTQRRDLERQRQSLKQRENEINWTCKYIKHGFCPLQGMSNQDTITQTGAQGVCELTLGAT